MNLTSVVVPPGLDTEPRASDEAVLTVIVGVVWLGALGHILHVLRRERQALGLALLIGGGLCMLQEPMVDVNGSLYIRSDITVFTTWGRDMPLWGLFAYSLYWGYFPFVLSRRAEHGLSMADYRWIILGGFVLNLLIEIPPLSLGLYEYFGPQPFEVLGLPLHWLTLNCASAVAIAAVVTRGRELFRGARAVWAALLAIVLVPAASMGTGLPVFTALNAPDTSDVVIWASAVITIAIGLAVIEACGRLMTTARPAAPSASRHAEAETPVAA